MILRFITYKCVLFPAHLTVPKYLGVTFFFQSLGEKHPWKHRKWHCEILFYIDIHFTSENITHENITHVEPTRISITALLTKLINCD